MIKIIIIVLTISFSGCNISSNNSKISEFDHLNKRSLSISSTYLTASYYISKGDAYTASNILNANTDDFKLLELKFISNLMSGNFEYANKISNSFGYDEKKGPVYILPELAIALNKNNLETSLQALKKIKNFLNLNSLTELIEFWLFHLKNKSNLNFNSISQKSSIYKLLILENFYDAKKLKEIADENYKLKNLTNNDLLLLAGYYFRLNDIQKFNIIIEDRLSNQFDKKYLIKNFSVTENIFYKIPSLRIILASKIYNNININNSQEYSSSDLKILLEMVLYLCPNMDIAKFSLAELYNDQKSKQIALEKLELISSTSLSEYTQIGNAGITTLGQMERLYGIDIIVTNELLSANNASRNLVCVKGKCWGLASQRKMEIEFQKNIAGQYWDIVWTHRVGVDILDPNTYVIVSTVNA